MIEIKRVNFKLKGYENSVGVLCEDRQKLDCRVGKLSEKLSDSQLLKVTSQLMIPVNSADYEAVWAEADKLDLIAENVGYKVKYTALELKNAKWYLLKLDILDDDVEEYNTNYTEGICVKCQKEKVIFNKPIYIDKVKFKGKNMAITAYGDIIISEKIKMLLEENAVTGVGYEEVYHKNNRLKNDYKVYRLLIENVMKPMDALTTMYYEDMYCDECKKYGCLLTTYPRYKTELLKTNNDFNLTYEYFGGGFSGLRYPIVSNSVYNILCRIHGCRFEIVEEV